MKIDIGKLKYEQLKLELFGETELSLTYIENNLIKTDSLPCHRYFFTHNGKITFSFMLSFTYHKKMGRVFMEGMIVDKEDLKAFDEQTVGYIQASESTDIFSPRIVKDVIEKCKILVKKELENEKEMRLLMLTGDNFFDHDSWVKRILSR